MEDLANRFQVESVPYVCFIRGGATKDHVLDSVKGFGPKFLAEFSQLIFKHSTEEERAVQAQFRDNAPGENIEDVIKNISLSPHEVDALAALPLADVGSYIVRRTRKELGTAEVDSNLAFDISRHESASTAVAQSILTRIKQDVHAYADSANKSASPKILYLSDAEVTGYFAGREDCEQTLRRGLNGIRELLQRLVHLRDQDIRMVQECVPMLKKAANWIALPEDMDPGDRRSRTRFFLLRTAGLNAMVWVEFLFGALLSSRGEEDLLRLNPFLGSNTVRVMMSLCIISMLRANRVGHANRCIGTAIGLLALLEKVRCIKSAYALMRELRNSNETLLYY